MSLISDIHADLENGAVRLITEYRARLFADAVQLCGNSTDAEDLVSRTFLKVLDRIDQHRPDGDFYGWMKAILTNIHRDDQDRPVTRGTVAVDAATLERYAGADTSTDDQILANSDRDALREAISQLEPEYRQAVAMYYFNELSLREIAVFLNSSTSSVSRKLEVARKILAAKLEEKLGKKPVALFLAALLGIGSLFGAWKAAETIWPEAFSSAPEAEQVAAADPLPQPEETLAADALPTVVPEDDEPAAADTAGEAAQAEPPPATDLKEEQVTQEQVNTKKTEGEETMGAKKLTVAVGAAVAAVGAMAATVDHFVEYVETSGKGSTGNQYVLLDYRPTKNSVIEAEVAFLDKSFSQCFFCSRGNATGTKTFTVFWVGGNGIRWDYNRTSAVYAGNDITAGNKVSLRFANNGLWINDVKTDMSVTPADYTPANMMTLFASYTCAETATPRAADNYAKMRLYSFKAYDDDGETLKVDLRPCVDSDGKAGLYDFVSGAIYYNKGTTPFVIGSIVEVSRALGCVIGTSRSFLGCGVPEMATATTWGDTTGVRYFWDIDGDGTFEAEGKRQRIVFETPGEHVVTLKVTNTAGEEASCARTFTARPPLNVPSASYPNIATALAAAQEGDMILLAEETYKTSECGAAEDALYPVDVPAGVEIRGGGATPADTVIDAEDAGRILRLAAGARASNLTLANFQLLPEMAQKTTLRGVALDARLATVEDCIIRDGKVGAVRSWEHYIYLEGTVMRRTTVTNCRYTGTERAIWTDSAGVAIYALAQSVLEDVTVEDCRTKGGNSGGKSVVAPVVLSDSSMSHSIVRRNSECYAENAPSAGGLLLYGASTLTDTLVESNAVTDHCAGSVAGGINMDASSTAVIDRCIIRGNSMCNASMSTPTVAGGIFASYGSTLRNCLIYGNSGPASVSVAVKSGSAGGVAMRSNSGSATGRMENCTVYGNTLVYNPNAAGVHMSDWTVVNSIVYGNKATLTGGSVTYSLMPDAVEGEGNITGDPLFVDAENGNFKLTYVSPCVDSGTELDSVTVDLEGAVRPQDGKLSGTPVTDRGCYEMPPNDIPLDCSLSVPVPLAAAPYDVTVSAEVTGTRKTGLSYAWVCIGAYAGVTTRVEKVTSEPTCVFEGLGYGAYTFELTVTNDHEPQPDVAKAAARDALQVSSSVCYVSPNGGNVWPYSSVADAATNLCDAAAATTEKVSVLPGSYAAMRHVTDADTGHDALVILSRPISIEGPSDPSAAVINCAGGGGLILGNAGAKVSGLTLTNFMTTAGLKSSALNIAAGAVSNVVLRAEKTVRPDKVSPVIVRGLLTDSVITGISISAWDGVPVISVRGAGTLRKVSVVGNTITTYGLLDAAAENGLRPQLENCVISGNKAYNWGLNLTSADVVGCNVLSNTVSPGIMVNTLSSTSLRRCRIFGNKSSSASVVMAQYQRKAGATELENCLIVSNTVTGTSVSAVDVSKNQGGAKVVNCTIADNVTVGGTGIAANVGDGKAYLDMVNTIVAGHVAAAGAADVSSTSSDATIGHSCFAEAVEGDGNGNIAKDPRFKGRGKAPYALKLGSPCLASGDESRWTDADVDLVGNPRRIKGAVDMGCYENLIKGLMLMLK